MTPGHDCLLPLPAAAASAYEALVGSDAQRTEGLLNVVAIALAACIPIYGARSPHEPLARLSDAEVARGKFAHGAAVLRFRDGSTPVTRLAVTRGDFEQALARLQRAGVNFSHARCEQAPRRLPRIAPALAFA